MGSSLSSGSGTRSPFHDYDIVIDIESLENAGEGWPITVTDYAKGAVLKQIELTRRTEAHKEARDHPIPPEGARYRNSLVVSAIGLFNNGKTFLLNQLAKIYLPSDTSVHTRGLSFILPDPEVGSDFVLLDTAGTNSPMNVTGERDTDEKMVAKRSTELFLQNLVVQLSDVLIVVVSHLTWSDQELIRSVQDSTQKSKRGLLVVHNFKGVGDETELIKNWSESVLIPFRGDTRYEYLRNMTKSTTAAGANDGDKGFYFVEAENNTHHFFLAKDKTPAGDKYNHLTIQLVRNHLRQMVPVNKEPVIQRVEKCATFCLQKCLKNPGKVEIKLSADIPQIAGAAVEGASAVREHNTREPRDVRSKQKPDYDPFTFDRAAALREKEEKRQLERKNAFALLTVAGQTKDDLSVANKSIVFDGFRIHLFEQGKFTPQYDVHSDNTGFHVIIDIAGVDVNETETIEANFKLQPEFGQRQTSYLLEIKGTRRLMYHKLTAVKSESARDQFESRLLPFDFKKERLEDSQMSRTPRVPGRFLITVPVDPEQYEVEFMPLVFAATGVVQVSVPKRKKPTIVTFKRNSKGSRN